MPTSFRIRQLEFPQLLFLEIKLITADYSTINDYFGYCVVLFGYDLNILQKYHIIQYFNQKIIVLLVFFKIYLSSQ